MDIHNAEKRFIARERKVFGLCLPGFLGPSCGVDGNVAQVALLDDFIKGFEWEFVVEREAVDHRAQGEERVTQRRRACPSVGWRILIEGLRDRCRQKNQRQHHHHLKQRESLRASPFRMIARAHHGLVIPSRRRGALP
jgi:hypothetical protein